MTIRQPRYSKEEFAQRGDEMYDSQIRSQIDEQSDRGRIVAIDINESETMPLIGMQLLRGYDFYEFRQ